MNKKIHPNASHSGEFEMVRNSLRYKLDCHHRAGRNGQIHGAVGQRKLIKGLFCRIGQSGASDGGGEGQGDILGRIADAVKTRDKSCAVLSGLERGETRLSLE